MGKQLFPGPNIKRGRSGVVLARKLPTKPWHLRSKQGLVSPKKSLSGARPLPTLQQRQPKESGREKVTSA